MSTAIKLRGDTKMNWLSANPVLLDRETVIETDTLRFKVGNGTSAYSGLPYTSGGNILEYSAQIYQSGTASPIFQSPQVNSLSVGDAGYGEGICYGTNFRSVISKRTGVGEYDISVVWDSIQTDYTKLAIMFGDAAVRIASTSQGSGNFGQGTFDKTWRIQTYNVAGVLADGVLLGNNGTYVNIKLYPTT